jgi:hypothetical protein
MPVNTRFLPLQIHCVAYENNRLVKLFVTVHVSTTIVNPTPAAAVFFK